MSLAWVGDHIKEIVGATGTGATVFIIFFKDSIREMWQEYHARKRAEREAQLRANLSAPQASPDKSIIGELIGILRQDLQENRTLLKELTVLMGDFRDTMKKSSATADEALTLAKATRESQMWVEREFRPGRVA